MPRSFKRCHFAALPVSLALTWVAVMFPGRAGELLLKVENLRCEGRTDPQAIDSVRPHLSWLIVPDGAEPTPRGVVQTAWQILASKSADALARNEGELWDSGRVESDASIQIPYGGREPAPSVDCWWKVRIWAKDAEGRESLTPWSRPAFWRRGLVNAEAAADWIACVPPGTAGAAADPTALFRHDFIVEKEVSRAIVYYSSTGYCELFINGERIGDGVGIPALTDRSCRLLYLTHEVSRRVAFGRNTVGLVTYPAFGSNGRPAAAWLLLLIDHPDGTRSTVGTGRNWKAAFESDLLPRRIGATQAEAGAALASADFNPDGWSTASPAEKPLGNLMPQTISPARTASTHTPVASAEIGDGAWRFDFGRVVQGRPRVSGVAQPGVEIVLRPLLRGAEVVGGVEKWTPAQGGSPGPVVFDRRSPVIRFDSIEVGGFDRESGTPTVEATQINDDLRPASSFSCSDAKIEAGFLESRTRLTNGCFGVLSDLHDGPFPRGHLGGRAFAIAGDLLLLDLAAAAGKWHRDVLDGSRSGSPPPAWVPPVGDPPPASWDAALAVASVPLSLFVIGGDRRPLDAAMNDIRAFVHGNREELFAIASGKKEGNWHAAGPARDALAVAALALALGGDEGESAAILAPLAPLCGWSSNQEGLHPLAPEMFYSALGKSPGARPIMGLGGIRPDPLRPGFKRAWISPDIPAGLRAIDAGYLSPHGWFRCSWTVDGGGDSNGQILSARVEIPPNASALITLPFEPGDGIAAGNPANALPDGPGWSRSPGDERAVFEAGSGVYEFAGRLTRGTPNETPGGGGGEAGGTP